MLAQSHSNDRNNTETAISCVIIALSDGVQKPELIYLDHLVFASHSYPFLVMQTLRATVDACQAITTPFDQTFGVSMSDTKAFDLH